jgi:hypothetical protein
MKSDSISGMRLFQITFDCCNAIPEPCGEKLLYSIIEYLKDHTRKVREVYTEIKLGID